MTTCYPITNYAMKDGNHTAKLNDDADDNDNDNDGIIKVKRKRKEKLQRKKEATVRGKQTKEKKKKKQTSPSTSRYRNIGIVAIIFYVNVYLFSQFYYICGLRIVISISSCA